VTDFSPAAQALNLGGAAETDEQRKKRLLALQQSRSQISSSLGNDMSPASAAYMNFGGLGLQ
jgi:hypothetical protein